MIGDPKHWLARAARMHALAVKMAGSQAAILMNDLAIHYEELADQALKDKSPPNGHRRWAEKCDAVSISGRRSTQT
jgi:hypothetical protein